MPTTDLLSMPVLKWVVFVVLAFCLFGMILCSVLLLILPTAKTQGDSLSRQVAPSSAHSEEFGSRGEAEAT